MSFSHTLRWSVLLLLVVTLGWKWALSGQRLTAAGDGSEEEIAVRHVSAFLTKNHFQVEGPREVIFGMQLLIARGGLCHMNVALTASRGWHRDLIENLSQGARERFVVFGGKIYSEQPMWLTVMDFLLSRGLQGFGFSAHSTPVITIMAGPNCDAKRLPWSDLSHSQSN